MSFPSPKHDSDRSSSKRSRVLLHSAASSFRVACQTPKKGQSLRCVVEWSIVWVWVLFRCWGHAAHSCWSLQREGSHWGRGRPSGGKRSQRNCNSPRAVTLPSPTRAFSPFRACHLHPMLPSPATKTVTVVWFCFTWVLKVGGRGCYWNHCICQYSYEMGSFKVCICFVLLVY